MTQHSSVTTVKSSTQIGQLAAAYSDELPREVSTSTLPSVVPAARNYVAGLIDPELRSCLTTQELDDIVRAISNIARNEGMADFVNAMALFVIHRDKKYSQRGFSSFEEFLDSLPEDLRMTRQSAMNYVYAGDVLINNLYFLEYGFSGHPGVDMSFLFGNFAKLPTLWNILTKQKRRFTAEVFEHFKRDSLVEFRQYAKGDKVSPKRAEKKRVSADTISLPTLTDDKRMIAEIVRRAHVPGFIVGHDSSFAINVGLKLKARREMNDQYRRDHAYDETLFAGRTPALLHSSGRVMACVQSLEEHFSKMTLEGIMRVVREQFKTKADVMLIKGYIIVLLLGSDHLRSQLRDFGVTTVEEFAGKYLDINANTYKWIKKATRNFIVYAPLFGDDLSVSYQSSLEKLFYLDTAIKQHAGQAPYVIDMFRALSTAQFREFARNTSYDPDKDLASIPKRILKKAEPHFLAYDERVAKGQQVHIIELRNSDEQRFLDWIVRTEESRSAHIRTDGLLAAPESPILLGYEEPLALPEGRAAESVA